MNSIKAVHTVDTHSVHIECQIEVRPQFGIDGNGPFKKTSQAGCAQALAILLDGLEGSEAELREAIEIEINGNNDDSTDADS